MNATTPSGKSRAGLWTAIVVALAVGVGVLVERTLRDAPAEQAGIAASTTGALPDGGDATPITDGSLMPGAGSKVPEVLPQFELQDREGKLRSLGEWKGRPVMVNYWATWCPPCVREIPLLSQLRRERTGENLEVVGIAVDFREDVLKFADERQLDYPLLIGEEDGLAAVEAVGMTPAFPFTLFADSQQRIIAMKVGELHHDEATLILDRVAAVDAGTLDVILAREQISAGLKELATRRGIDKAAEAAAGINPG